MKKRNKLKASIMNAIAAWHMKWVKNNLPAVTKEISDNIVFQMWAAGVKFDHINKWLMWRKMKPIICYVVMAPGKMNYFTEEPSTERKAELRMQGKRLVHIA